MSDSVDDRIPISDDDFGIAAQELVCFLVSCVDEKRLSLQRMNFVLGGHDDDIFFSHPVDNIRA